GMPRAHQAREQDRHHAAAMAERDAQLWVTCADAAGDHRGARESDVAGETDGLLDERADDAVLACRAQRVHEDRRARLLGGGEERLVAPIANGNPIHMARDLDAGKAELAAVLELADRGVDILD